MRYPLVIFDWDGTLMDSTGRIVDCLRNAAAELRLPSLPDSRLREIIGLGLPEAIQDLWPMLTAADNSRMREVYAEYFIAAESQPNALFPGAQELLVTLKAEGVCLAVATGKSRKGLSRVWQNTGYGEFFDLSICADESRSKPHPAMIFSLLEDAGMQAGSAVMIGDTSFDMDMARSAGVAGIAVSYGAHESSRLERCDPVALIESLFELPPLLMADSASIRQQG